MRMARLFTARPKPFRRFCVTEKLSEPCVTGLKSLLGEFCLYPRTLPIPSDTLVPVRKPCWTPKFACLYEVTRKFVPVTKELVCGEVWCRNCELTKNVGSRFGMADPASCTLNPLSTPPVLLLLLLPVEPSELAPASAPR